MVGTQQVVGNNYNYMQIVVPKLKAESILYIRFIDTLATYLLCELKLPNPISSSKRVDRGLPRNLKTHDKSRINVASQLDKPHQDLYKSITNPIPTNPVRITDRL
jgi:hypothetical protein